MFPLLSPTFALFFLQRRNFRRLSDVTGKRRPVLHRAHTRSRARLGRRGRLRDAVRGKRHKTRIVHVIRSVWIIISRFSGNTTIYTSASCCIITERWKIFSSWTNEILTFCLFTFFQNKQGQYSPILPGEHGNIEKHVSCTNFVNKPKYYQIYQII